ncbi:Hydrolase, TatD family [Desulfosarcina cetonica]|nr:Hydrolase, TatD family [Desulfosarcina cetonica]
MLIDSHAHLDAPYFTNQLATVLKRAHQAGVEKIITVGVVPASTRKCIQIAKAHASVFPTAGYHPHWAAGADQARLAEAEQLARHPAVVAIGEIGLDYHHLRSPKQDQQALFRQMLDIAVAVRLPIVIHDRNAHADIYASLAQVRSRLSGGIIHCFSGNWRLARKYLDWGFFLSIPGTVTYPQAMDLREVATKMPLAQMLLETDAPHLTPAPMQGKRNEPAFIAHTARAVARLRKIPVAEVSDATARNVLRAFPIKANRI